MKKQDQTNFNYNEYLTQQLQIQDCAYLKMLENGESAEDIVAKMFAQYYGCSATDPRVINRVKRQKAYVEAYHTDFEKLAKNKEEWIRNALVERVDLMETAKERCEFYRRVYIALEAYNIKNSGEENAEQKAIEYVEDQLSCEYTEEEAKKNEQQLIDAIVIKYMGTDFLTKEVSDILTVIEDVISDKELYCVAFAYGRESEGIKLILSSQACINASKGAYSDINKYTSEKDITYAICAGVDVEAVAADVAKGAVNVTAMEEVMEVVSFLCSLCMCISISQFLGSTMVPVIVSLLGFSPILALVAVALVSFGITLYVYNNFGDKLTADIADAFCPIGRIIDKGISKIITSIRNAIDNRKKAIAGIPEIDCDIPRVFLNTTDKKAAKLPAEQRPDKNRDYDFLHVNDEDEDEDTVNT